MRRSSSPISSAMASKRSRRAPAARLRAARRRGRGGGVAPGEPSPSAQHAARRCAVDAELPSPGLDHVRVLVEADAGTDRRPRTAAARAWPPAALGAPRVRPARPSGPGAVGGEEATTRERLQLHRSLRGPVAVELEVARSKGSLQRPMPPARDLHLRARCPAPRSRSSRDAAADPICSARRLRPPRRRRARAPSASSQPASCALDVCQGLAAPGARRSAPPAACAQAHGAEQPRVGGNQHGLACPAAPPRRRRAAARRRRRPPGRTRPGS